jgi:hypothetical protein
LIVHAILIALAVVGFSASPALAGPLGGLFALLATPAMGTLSIGGGILGSLAVRLVTSVALSALSRALQPRPPVTGIRTEQTLAGAVHPETFILGKYATGGVLMAPPMTHGRAGRTPNAYLNYVVELAGIPGHTLTGIFVDGEEVDILPDDPHEDYGQRLGGRFLGRAWVRYHDGTQTSADAMLLAKYPAPYIRPWPSTMVAPGICYAVLTFLFDRDVYQSLPQVRFVLQGLPLIDPRTGTAAQTDNPVVMLYNLYRGITLPSGDVWGGGVPADDLPQAAWAAAADACDATVTVGAGTQPRYRAGYEVTVQDEPFAVVDELAKACGGVLIETGGVWVPRVGGPGLPVLFVTDDDIIAGESEEYDPFPEQIYNAITATFPSPASQWAVVETPPRLNAEWEAEDGNRRLRTTLQLPAVPYRRQARRLIADLITDHRRMKRHALTLGPGALALTAGDVIAWTSDQHGYDAKTFEVVELVRDLLTQQSRLSLREVDPTDWGQIGDVTLPSPVSPSPGLAGPQSVALTAVPWVLAVSGVNRRGGIYCEWDPEAAEDARGVRLAVRQAGDTGSGREYPLYRNDAGRAVLVDGLVPGDHEVRARYVLSRATAWSGWVPVEVPDVRVTLADLEADIVSWLGTMEGWIDAGITDLPATLIAGGERWRELFDEVHRLAAEVGEIAADERVVRLETDRALAQVRQTFEVRIVDVEGLVGATASAVTEVLASIPALATAASVATLTATVVAQGDTIAAQGSAITTINATLPGLATAASVASLTATVVAQGDTIAAQGSAITTINATLPGLATAASVASLTSTVTAQGSTITAQGSAITTINATLPGLATAASVASLTSTVTAQGSTITALSDALIAATAAVGGTVADARFRATAVTGPSGFARVGLQVRYDSGDTFRSAGLFLDAPANPANPTRVAVQADQFAVIVGSTGVVPFNVTAGEVRVSVPVVSSNYAESGGVPTAGFRLDPATGTIKAVEVIARLAIAPAAVNDAENASHNGNYTPAALNTWYTLIEIALSNTVLGEQWVVVAGGEYRQQTGTKSYNGDSYSVAWTPRVNVQRRTQKNSGASFSSWQNIGTESVASSTSYDQFTALTATAGKYHTVEYRVQVRLDGSSVPSGLPTNQYPATPVCFRDYALTARRPQR